MDHALDGAFATIGLLVALGLLLLGAAVALLVWFCVCAVIAHMRYQQYRKQAEARFDQIAAEQGLDFDVDAAIRAAYGVGVQLPDDGYENAGEWVAGSLFGVVEEEQIA